MKYINNYITEKLHIGKDKNFDYEVKDRESFIEYLNDNGCKTEEAPFGFKCKIYLDNSFKKSSNKYPYVVIYLYNDTWDIEERPSKSAKGILKFMYDKQSYSTLKYFQFKRGAAPRGGYGLFYNEENAEKIVNKLKYLWTDVINK